MSLYTNMEKCTLCDSRRARRNCPALSQDICPQCCGSKREETIACPLSCVYLQEGRRHEKMVTLAPEQFPNRDVRIEDDFLEQQRGQFTICGAALYKACEALPGVLDSDVREALDALVEKYRTSLIYEPTLQNSVAAAVYRGFEKGVEEFREKIRSVGENTETFIDQFMFRIVVFLQRLALMHNNGRAKGRYYIQFLSGLTRPMSTPEAMAEGQ